MVRDHARGSDYGDWLSVGADTPKDLIGTAYFAHSADIVARSLAVLGRLEEAAAYRALFADIRTAFTARFVSADGRIAGDTQTGYLLALNFDLLEAPARLKALERLVSDIEAKDNHLSTGFLGVGMLLPVLSNAGRADIAWDLLMQDTFPSWLFAVRHGATTIWERWDGWTPEHGPHADTTMNSFNHYALGSCGSWLFEGVGGITPDPQSRGLGHFFVRPCVEGPLDWAMTTLNSMRGEITTRWEREPDALTLCVIVPANARATVHVPARRGADVLESGQPIDRAVGVSVLERRNEEIVLSVGSGSYEFTSMPPR